MYIYVCLICLNISVIIHLATPADFKKHIEWRLYEYISRHFLASLSTNLKYSQIKLSLSLTHPNLKKFNNLNSDPSPAHPDTDGMVGLSHEYNEMESIGFGAAAVWVLNDLKLNNNKNNRDMKNNNNHKNNRFELTSEMVFEGYHGYQGYQDYEGYLR